ncbi:hypothetical protein [Chryseobacterium scophthalmum]|uniref:Replication initiation factor n=1 Tax=Chryseobacterium scophthalmum TaxID=59733 RepID=A0A1N6IWJ7_9FLAO|nr:hypothetical protein [Chryseobacterium scophthalmum]SIO36418.1 hypothetical protein SAMN05421769_3852 [Chryseobacterium scophthalmum]
MIDFIKVYTYTKESLENRIKNDFPDSETKCSYDYFNKTPKYPCKRYFENIEVRITDKSAFVRNSIHTYFNLKNGVAEGNYTDFSYGDILTAFEQLQGDLNEDILDYKVTNLEFGLNIRTSLSPKQMLENNFLMFNFDEFNQKDAFGGKGAYKQYNRNEYYVKMYDKGLQYRLPYNLLRVEIKITDSKMLKKRFGIHLVRDIFEKSRLELLFKWLLACFDEINIIDNLATQEIRGEEKTVLELGKSPHYWREIKNSKSSTYYYNLRSKYIELLEKYQLYTIKQELRNLLVAKFQSLIEG